MDVYPNALSEYLLCHLIGMSILEILWTSGSTPEAVAGSVGVLLKGSRANGELRDILDALSFFHAKDLVGLVEVLEELLA
jgi:hypothetical protein